MVPETAWLLWWLGRLRFAQIAWSASFRPADGLLCWDPTEGGLVTVKAEKDPEPHDDAPEPQPPGSLAEALLAFQADPPQTIKDAEGEVRGTGKTGKAYSYKYKYMSLQALLDAVRPRLSELGLLWLTSPGVNEAGKPVLEYVLHHVPSKEMSGGMMPLVAGSSMQDLGGALSYARRYALITVLNLAPDVDEDGAVAALTPEKRITKKMAEQLVAEAVKLGLLGRLQLAASHVHGGDVGDCSTRAKAVMAVVKLSEDEAERLFSKMAEIGGQKAGESADV